MTQYSITTYYKFKTLSTLEVEELRLKIEKAASVFSISGLIIMGTEGINSTVAGLPENIIKYKNFLLSLNGFEDLLFKDSTAPKNPFKRFKIKERDEIVTIDNTELIPQGFNNHLTPTEWREMLKNEDVLLIDTRNWYEFELGRFAGAINPKIEMFNEFPDYVASLNVSKDKKVLMYCTGGIRCEKASLEMQRQGFNNVYQLSGGILKYLEEYPNDTFEGECFVFDQRVAVDQKLMPTSTWKLCPLCGNPGKYNLNSCGNCGKSAVICDCCAENGKLVCSKNCHYHMFEKNKEA
jgi:UPF0176 protein